MELPNLCPLIEGCMSYTLMELLIGSELSSSMAIKAVWEEMTLDSMLRSTMLFFSFRAVSQSVMSAFAARWWMTGRLGAGGELLSVKGTLYFSSSPSTFPFKVAVQSVLLRAFCDFSVAYTTNCSPLKTGGGFCGLCVTLNFFGTSKLTETSVMAGCRARLRLRITFGCMRSPSFTNSAAPFPAVARPLTRAEEAPDPIPKVKHLAFLRLLLIS
jgi:hypothetical protein